MANEKLDRAPKIKPKAAPLSTYKMPLAKGKVPAPNMIDFPVVAPSKPMGPINAQYANMKPVQFPALHLPPTPPARSNVLAFAQALSVLNPTINKVMGVMDAKAEEEAQDSAINAVLSQVNMGENVQQYEEFIKGQPEYLRGHHPAFRKNYETQRLAYLGRQFGITLGEELQGNPDGIITSADPSAVNNWVRSRAQAYVEELSLSNDPAAMARGLFPEIEKTVAQITRQGTTLRAKRLYDDQKSLWGQETTTAFSTFFKSADFLNVGTREEAMKLFAAHFSERMFKRINPDDPTSMGLSGTDVNTIVGQTLLNLANELDDPSVLQMADYITTNPKAKAKLGNISWFKSAAIKLEDRIYDRKVSRELQKSTLADKQRRKDISSIYTEAADALFGVDGANADITPQLNKLKVLNAGAEVFDLRATQERMKQLERNIVDNPQVVDPLEERIYRSDGSDAPALLREISQGVQDGNISAATARTQRGLLKDAERYGHIFATPFFKAALSKINAQVKDDTLTSALSGSASEAINAAQDELHRITLAWASEFKQKNDRSPTGVDFQNWARSGVLSGLIKEYKDRAAGLKPLGENKPTKGEEQGQQSQYPPLEGIRPETAFNYRQQLVLPFNDPKQFDVLLNEYMQDPNNSWLGMAAARAGVEDAEDFILAQGVQIGAIKLINAKTPQMFDRIYKLLGSPRRPSGPDGPWVPDLSVAEWELYQRLLGNSKPAPSKPAFDPKAAWRQETANDYYD